MSEIFQKYAALREKYPDDVKQIEAEEERVADLLRQQDYSQLPATKELLGMCRRDVISARLRLAKERTLKPEERDALWHIIDARSWVLEVVAKDFDAEIAQIDADLEAELSR
jgi:hypothetical protein